MTTAAQRHVAPMFKAAFALAIVGFINGLIGAGVTYYLNSHLPTDLESLQTWERIVDFIWPSAMMMMPGDAGGSVIVLALSVLANGCLYGVVGFAAGAIWQKLTAAMR